MIEKGVMAPPKQSLLEALGEVLGVEQVDKAKSSPVYSAWARWFSLVTLRYPFIQVFDVAITPAQVNANTTSEQDFTVTGILAGRDVVLSVNKPTHQTGLGIVGWRVKAADTISVAYMNNTAGNITPTSETNTFIVMRK